MMSSVKKLNIVKITCYNYTRFCSMPMGYKKFRGKLGYIQRHAAKAQDRGSHGGIGPLVEVA
jgi:hypothetical protein